MARNVNERDEKTIQQSITLNQIRYNLKAIRKYVTVTRSIIKYLLEDCTLSNTYCKSFPVKLDLIITINYKTEENDKFSFNS